MTALLAELFPFFVAIGGDGPAGARVRALGPRWASFAPSVTVGTPFAEAFAVDRPFQVTTVADFVARPKDVFLLRALAHPTLQFRGQMCRVDGSDNVYFLGGPWIVRMEDLATHALRLDDFPPHDPRGDLLVLVQARESMVADLRTLTTRLRETAARLDERNRELEEQAALQKRLEEQLRQSQRLEAIGRFAGGVAHDFNNILMAIGAHVALADAALQTPNAPDTTATVAESLTQIRSASDRAAQLTQQLLAFSKQRLVSLARVDPAKEVLAIAALLRPLLGDSVRLRTEIADDLGPLWADPSSFQQILVNLALNARDAMPDGGELTIALRRAGGERPMLVLTVTDTGIGMSDETLANAFDPFFTTKPAGKGSGLGLATVHGLIVQASGTITVHSRSEPPSGTTFELSWPLSPAPAPLPPAEVLLTEGRPPTDEVLVLLVEDDDAIRRLMERLLTRAGYHVTALPDPREAGAVAARAPIAALVTDVVMPHGSGPEVALAVEAHRPNIPTIFMSGYTEDTRLRAEALRPNQRFLAKPFPPGVLLATLQALLAREGSSQPSTRRPL